MKKEYVKPSMNIEMFQANEYIAACGVLNCDLRGNGTLYIEGNGEDGYQAGTLDKLLKKDANISHDHSHPNVAVNQGQFQKGNQVIDVYYYKDGGEYHYGRTWTQTSNAS